MSYTMRVTLSGSDALTETDPDGYALYADEDWVLIKEKARGTGTLDYNSSDTISHGLSYAPFVLLWGEDANGDLIMQGWTNTFQLSNMWAVEVDSSNVTVTQGVQYPSTLDYNYYIFYDELE